MEKRGKEECFITWLPGHGYTVTSIPYRFSGVAKFPAQLYDCNGAVRWLRAHAVKYGYNPNIVFVAGGECGRAFDRPYGHLIGLQTIGGERWRKP